MSCAPTWDGLCIEQAETFVWDINYKNLNLTTYTDAVFEVTDTLGGTTILSATLAGVQITLADGSDLVTFNIQIVIPAATVAAAPFTLAEHGYYQITLTDASGVVVVALRGRVKLNKAV